MSPAERDRDTIRIREAWPAEILAFLQIQRAASLAAFAHIIRRNGSPSQRADAAVRVVVAESDSRPPDAAGRPNRRHALLMGGGPYHVRVLVLWRGQILLVQHQDGRDGVSFWMPPGGGSEPGESAEAAAVREVKEETGLDVRVVRQVPVPVERSYVCFLAELVGADAITPEVEEPFDGIYASGAAWHPVTHDAPLAVMDPEHWSGLAPVIREELARQDRIPPGTLDMP